MKLFDPEIEERRRALAKKAALSGGLSGALLGAGTSVLGAKSAKSLIRPSLEAGLFGAAAAGGSSYLGSHLLGPADEDDSPSAYTDRAATGGALGGGLLGGGLGALAGSRKSSLLNKLMSPNVIPKGSAMGPILEKPNILTQGFEAATRLGGKKGALIGAALGGLGLGAATGFMGADEGMQLDLLNNKIKEAQRRKRREELIDDF